MRLYRHELRGQSLSTPAARLAFFTFLFPLILFLLLGSAYGDEEIEGIRGSDFLMAGTLGFGAVATAFGGLAIVLVLRREEGILKRLRATPLPSVDYIAAVLSTTMLAFLIQAVVTIAIAMLAFGASFPDRPVSLVAALVLGVAAFAALGVAITGFIRRAEGASAVVNAIYFPVLFISGSFFSQGSFPTILERVATVLPVSLHPARPGDLRARRKHLGASDRRRRHCRLGPCGSGRCSAHVSLDAHRGLRFHRAGHICLANGVGRAIAADEDGLEPPGLEFASTSVCSQGARRRRDRRTSRDLARKVHDLTIVSEGRHEFDDHSEASVHQVRIEVPSEALGYRRRGRRAARAPHRGRRAVGAGLLRRASRRAQRP